MKKASMRPSLLHMLFIGLLLSNFNALSQKTTIWIVRHAEKDTLNKSTDPVLSAAGQRRAMSLASVLKRKNIRVVYVTRFKRTSLTVNPFASKAKIPPRIYTDSLKQFADLILKDFKGDNVLIAGHSNTIMPLLAVFGAPRPFTTLADDDYDMLFKVVLSDKGKAELRVYQYGDRHHSSDVPRIYRAEN